MPQSNIYTTPKYPDINGIFTFHVKTSLLPNIDDGYVVQDSSSQIISNESIISGSFYLFTCTTIFDLKNPIYVYDVSTSLLTDVSYNVTLSNPVRAEGTVTTTPAQYQLIADNSFSLIYYDVSYVPYNNESFSTAYHLVDQSNNILSTYESTPTDISYSFFGVRLPLGENYLSIKSDVSNVTLNDIVVKVSNPGNMDSNLIVTIPQYPIATQPFTFIYNNPSFIQSDLSYVLQDNYGNNVSDVFRSPPIQIPDIDWNVLVCNSLGNILYGCSLSYGIWTFSNDTNIWTQTTASTSISWSSITCDSSGQYVYACSNNQQVIYTSTDYGNTWNQSSGAPSVSWTSITCDGTGQFLSACATGDYIYYSQDYGNTWSQSSGTSTNSWKSISCDISNINVLCGADEGLYLSTDGGVTWNTSYDYNGFWKSVKVSSGNFYAVSNLLQTIYISVDGGNNWKPTTFTIENDNFNSITCDITGQHVIVSTTSKVYISTDHGDTFTAQNLPIENWDSVTCDIYAQNIYTSFNHGYVYSSNNSGLTWTSIPSFIFTNCVLPLGVTALTIKEITNNSLNLGFYFYNIVYSVLDLSGNPSGITENQPFTLVYNDMNVIPTYDTSYVLFDNLNNVLSTFNNQSTTPDKNGLWLSPIISINPNGIIVVDISNVFFSTSYQYPFPEWINLSTVNPSSQLPTNIYLSSISVDVSGNNILAVEVQNGYVFRFITQENLWVNLLPNGLPTENAFWHSSYSDSTFTNLCIVGSLSNTSGIIYLSNDSGNSWYPNTNKLFLNVTIFYNVTGDSTGKYLAVTTDKGVYVSNDYGSNWYKTSLPNVNISIIKSDRTGKNLFCSGSLLFSPSSNTCQNIYKSTDYGVTWTTTSAPYTTWFGFTLDENGQNIAAISYNLIYNSGVSGLIYISRDSGNTWTLSNAPSQPWISISSDSTGQYLVAGVHQGLLYTSSDYGMNWTTDSYQFQNVVLSKQYNLLEILDQSYNVIQSGIDLVIPSTSVQVKGPSQDFSISYPITRNQQTILIPSSIPVVGVPFTLIYNDISFCPQFGNSYVLNDENGLNVSDVYTQSTSAYATWNFVASDYTGQYLIVSTYKSDSTSDVLISNTYGATWNSFYSTGGNGLPALTHVNPPYWIIASNGTGQRVFMIDNVNNYVYSTQDYGSHWSANTISETDSVSSVCLDINGRYVYITGNNSNGRVYRSNDFGNSFITTEFSNMTSLKKIITNRDGSKLVTFGIDNLGNNLIYYSTDVGNSWSPSSSNGDISGNPWANMCSDNTGQFVYIFYNSNNLSVNNSYIYKSTDYGNTFTIQYTFYNSNHTDRNMSSICCDGTGNIVYISEYNGCIYKSVDGGNTFQSTSSEKNYWSMVVSDKNGKNLCALMSNIPSSSTSIPGYIFTSNDSADSWVITKYYFENVKLNTTGVNNLTIQNVGLDQNVVSLFVYVNGVCFKQGTKILCYNPHTKKESYRPIETLRKGDLVRTLRNGYIAIDMIGRSKMINTGDTERIKERLYKCPMENFPDLFEDLIITGCHSILEQKISKEQSEKMCEELGQLYTTEGLYRVMAFIDDRTEPYEEKGEFTIWHFALENPDYYMNYGVYANGLMVETCSKRYIRELSGMEIVK